MKRLVIFLFAAITLNNIYSQDLPRYMTEREQEIYKTYTHPFSIETNTTPPPFVPRTMAEWEELQGILITWTSHYSILAQIVDYAQEEGMVYIVCSDSNSVKNYLTNLNVPHNNLEFLYESFNSIWCRDYGPWTIYEDQASNISIVDWEYNRPRPYDDLIPVRFADYMNYEIYQTTVSPWDLTNTGGNFMTDGHGTGFASKLVLTENPGHSEAEIDNIMDEFMGITSFIKMNTLPYDAIHHIDMHMKLLDEETLLVGEYPAGVADGPMIEANLQYILDNYQTCFGNEYEVVRIPMPPDAYGRYPNAGGDYRTYTNSLIVNKTIIVPTYEEQYDTTALRIYREAMPGYNVVGIDCNSIIPQLGAIHCITKEIGHPDPIFISHSKMKNPEYADQIKMQAYIKSPSGIQKARLHWRIDSTCCYTFQEMTAMPNDSFYAYIPQQEPGTWIQYYLWAISNSGRIVTKPLPGPDGPWLFQAPYEEFTSNFSASEGWNLVSVPLQAADMSKDALFPDAVSYAFGYDGNAYQIYDELETGSAYWLKFDNSSVISVTGFRPGITIDVNEDWNMVGPFDEDFSVSDITTNPQGIIVSEFYGFDAGYTAADILQPGKGYWVKTSEAGQLYLNKKGTNKKNNLPSERIPENADRFIVTDLNGNTGSVFMAGNSAPAYELPPLPPAGIFDIRFSSNMKVEKINKGEQEIRIQSSSDYKINFDEEKYRLINRITGKSIKPGDVISANVKSINITTLSAPVGFAVSGNYPNPFNPSTRIHVNLPEAGKLKATVYNSIGERISVISNGEFESGTHYLEFNGTNIPSGVYFYTIEYQNKNENYSVTNKMLLIK